MTRHPVISTGRRWLRPLVFLTALLAVATATAGVPALAASPDSTAQSRVTKPKLVCEDLPAVDFGQIPGAPADVTTATVTRKGYEYCEARGTIAGRIQFALRLPTQTWAGRYLQVGCGALCGYVGFQFTAADSCAPLEDGTFAIATNNTGHVGDPQAPGIDARWGRDDFRAREDFGFRSEHLMSLAAKSIVAAFYGQRPAYSYFSQCSNGGRQALMSAQRYPDDFDGIIAGAPSNAWAAATGQSIAYLALANRDANGRDVLPAAKLAPLQQAAIDSCDRRDGLADGQIDDPRQCRFDPAAIACPTGADGPACLTPAQVTAARKIYAGVRDRHGTRLYPGGLEPGSETGWSDLAGAGTFAEAYLKHLAYRKNPPLSFTLADTRFDRRTFQAQQEMNRIYGAQDPDLSAFRDSGGKLIVWHGWSDQLIPPRGTLAYRQAMEDRMGGYAAVQRFSRLFMLPGVGHCGEGSGPDRIDLVSALLGWVEQGVAPSRITASRQVDGTVVRTRPVYNYPVQAKYNGSGDINNAGSFHPYVPAQRPNDRIRWMGSFR